MESVVGYEAWYNEQLNNQVVNEPVQWTLEGMKVLLDDSEVSDTHKAAARAYLRRLKHKVWVSDAFSAFCAVGAALSSMAYFMAMRGHDLEWNEFLVAPVIAGIFVAGATWYTYRNDTAEFFLNFTWRDNAIDYKKLFVASLTLLVVALEVALSGYGVYECLPGGNTQTALIAVVCMSALIPEWAQAYKYLEKWIIDTKEKYAWDKFKDARFSAYMFCSTMMLVFSGMAISPLLTEELTEWGAGVMTALYALLGLPYMWKKTEEHMAIEAAKKEASKSQANASTACFCICPFTVSRLGNGLGDLAFSAYGFFETMKALHLIEKPQDVFSALDGSVSDAWKPWLILMAGVCVVVTSCVGSYLMTAGGDQPHYREDIQRLKVASNDDVSENDVGSKNVFYTWRSIGALPEPSSLKPSPQRGTTPAS